MPDSDDIEREIKNLFITILHLPLVANKRVHNAIERFYAQISLTHCHAMDLWFILML